MPIAEKPEEKISVMFWCDFDVASVHPPELLILGGARKRFNKVVCRRVLSGRKW